MRAGGAASVTVGGGQDAGLAALEAVYRANVRQVYAYAATRLGRSEGEDVTGEVFHAAAVAYADGRSAAVTTAWLMAVTRNKVIDRWRRAERRMAKAHLLGEAAEPPDPLDLALDVERRDRVHDALDRLTHRHRQLLVLHHLEGQAVAAIADAVGQSVAAIESALARARRAFRSAYDALEEQR